MTYDESKFTQSAGEVIDCWIDYCVGSTGLGNCWKEKHSMDVLDSTKTVKEFENWYMWEIDHDQHIESLDGGFHGRVYQKSPSSGKYFQTTRFMIDRSGVVISAPPELANVAYKMRKKGMENE
jgi:hypothetical protein